MTITLRAPVEDFRIHIDYYPSFPGTLHETVIPVGFVSMFTTMTLVALIKCQHFLKPVERLTRLGLLCCFTSCKTLYSSLMFSVLSFIADETDNILFCSVLSIYHGIFFMV